MSDKTIKVYPHPSLAERLEYLPGIGADGAEIPAEQAEEMHAAGLVVKPKEPAVPADKEAKS